MRAALSILKALCIGLLAFIVLCFVPVAVGMLSVLLGDLLGCDFNNDTSSTVFCASPTVRGAIQNGTMMNWYALETLPLALIAAGVLLVTLIAFVLLRALSRR